MTERERIDKFYKDIEMMGMKFPGAKIVEATGYNKSTVSAYLSKREKPSEAFLKKFYEKFGDSLETVHGIQQQKPLNTKVTGESEVKPIDTLMQAVLNLTESNKILAANNEKLVNIIASNSGGTGLVS